MNNRLPKDHLLLLDAIASQRARDADKKQKGSSYFKIEIYFFPFLRRFELRWKSRHAYLDWIVREVGGNGSCWLLRSRCRSKPAAAEAAHHTHNGLGRLNIYRSTGLTGSLDSRVRWTSPPAASWFIFFFIFPCVTLERGEERNNRANRVMDRPVLLLLLLLGTHQKAYHASCGTPSPLSQNDAPQNPSNKLFRSSLSAMESTKRKKEEEEETSAHGRKKRIAADRRLSQRPRARVIWWRARTRWWLWLLLMLFLDRERGVDAFFKSSVSWLLSLLFACVIIQRRALPRLWRTGHATLAT